MELIDKNQILYMIDNIDRVVALKNEIDDIPIIEAIPIEWIEHNIPFQNEEDGDILLSMIDAWRKENERSENDDEL